MKKQRRRTFRLHAYLGRQSPAIWALRFLVREAFLTGLVLSRQNLVPLQLRFSTQVCSGMHVYTPKYCTPNSLIGGGLELASVCGCLF